MKRNNIFLWALVVFSFAVVSCKKQQTGVDTMADNESMVYKRIRKTIDDDEKRNALLALEAEVQLRQLDISFIYAEAGVKVRQQQNLTTEVAQNILTEAAEKRAKTFQDVAALRMQMRAMLTEDEWNKIYAESSAAAGSSTEEGK